MAQGKFLVPWPRRVLGSLAKARAHFRLRLGQSIILPNANLTVRDGCTKPYSWPAHQANMSALLSFQCRTRAIICHRTNSLSHHSLFVKGNDFICSFFLSFSLSLLWHLSLLPQCQLRKACLLLLCYSHPEPWLPKRNHEPSYLHNTKVSPHSVRTSHEWTLSMNRPNRAQELR